MLIKKEKNFFMRNAKLIFLFALFIVLNVFALIMYTSVHMIHGYGPEIVRDANDIDAKYHMAMVLGGGMNDDGSMSIMQTDRVQAGIDLYLSGKVDTILFTGDDGRNNDDEVSAMRAYAVEKGVDQDDIIADWHGYRTYESCYRAYHVFGVTSTIAISQEFHLPRILYMCKNMGMDVVGFAADRRVYNGIWTPYIRESLARVKGWIQIEFTNPEAQFLSK